MEFEYASLPALRAEGIDDTELPDDRARHLIRLASRRINECTTQWFWPVWGTWRISGSDSGIVIAPQMVPVLKVDQLSLLEPYSGQKYPYGSSDFYIVPPEDNSGLARQIELFSMGRMGGGGGTFNERLQDFILSQNQGDHNFPHGAGNLVLEGVLGWLENLKEVDTTTAADLSVDDTSLALTDASEIEEGDVVLIGEKIGLNVNGVSGNIISFDKARKAAPSGTRVRCFGRVPFDIVRATLMLVIRWKDPIGSEEGQTALVGGRLLSERTDNYSYTLGRDQGGGGGGDAVVTTGDTWVDQIIANFVPPPYVGFV